MVAGYRFTLIRLGLLIPSLLRCAFNPVTGRKWYHKRYHPRIIADKDNK